jgi:hypothetical protein
MSNLRERYVRASLVVGLVAAALAFPAATVAADPGCQADRKILNTWLKIVSDDQRFASVQVQGMLEILTLISQGQEATPGLVQRVRTATNQRKQVLDRGERRLKALKPGTANGRRLKDLGLRFIRNVARPFNACVSKMLVAQTPAELKATIDCTQAVQRRTNAIKRETDRLFARMNAEDRRCP